MVLLATWRVAWQVIDKMHPNDATRYRIPRGDEQTTLVTLPRKILVETPGGQVAAVAAATA